MLEISKKSLNVNSSYEKIKNSFTSSGDIIIPDSKPDVKNVLYVDVVPIIENTSINSEQLTITGNIEFNVIYASAEEASKIIRISTLIPFKNSFEVPGLTSESHFHLSLSSNSTNSLVLNERKISLKSNICVDISFFLEKTEEFIDEISQNQNIETLLENKNISTVLYNNCINTKISDSNIISSNLPNIEEIIKYDYKISNEELVLSDGQVMFKGELTITIFYTANDKKIYNFDYTIPYSNFINNCSVPPNVDYDLTSCITNLSLKILPDTDELMRVIEYSANISSYICVFEQTNINVISDIYSTNTRLSAETKELKYSVISPKQTENISLRGVITIPENDPINILSTLGKLKNLTITADNKNYILSGVIEVTIIYKNDSSNKIESSTVDMPINHNLSTPLTNLSNVCITNIEATQIEIEKFDIKLSLCISGNKIETNSLKLISNITESEQPFNKKNGITIYYPKENDTLWNIAKKYKTTVKKLKTINNLSENNTIVIGSPLIIN